MAKLPKNVQVKDGRLFVNITLRDIFENHIIDEAEEPLLAEIKRVYEENTKLREASERDADIMEALNLSLEEAQSKNAELQEEVRLVSRISKDTLVVSIDHERVLDDENEKLRKMCRDLYILRFEHQVDWKLAMETYEKYKPCDLCHREHGGKSPCASTAEDMSEECCNPYQAAIVAEKLRELGIEVPE